MSVAERERIVQRVMDDASGNLFKIAQLDIELAKSACEAKDAMKQEVSPATAEDLMLLANLQRLDKAIALLCQMYSTGQGDQPKEMDQESRKIHGAVFAVSQERGVMAVPGPDDEDKVTEEFVAEGAAENTGPVVKGKKAKTWRGRLARLVGRLFGRSKKRYH